MTQQRIVSSSVFHLLALELYRKKKMGARIKTHTKNMSTLFIQDLFTVYILIIHSYFVGRVDIHVHVHVIIMDSELTASLLAM